MTSSFTRFAGRLFVAAIALCLFAGALSAGTFTVSPTQLTFTVTNVGSTSKSQVVTVTNGTSSTVTISSITLTAPNAGDFTIVSKTCSTSLAAAASCTVTMAFKPTVNNIREANLAISDSAAGSPQTVNMTGFGQAAAQTLIFDPDALTFPITNIGTSSAQLQVQVTNFGTTGVTFSGVSLVGGAPSDFSISSNTCTSLNEGGSCYIYVTFTPTKAGARQENLEITSNAPGSPFVVLLLGTGQALTQTINISPNSISYGVNDIGATSSQQYFQIQNTGTGPVTMEGIVISGANSNEYAIASNGCPALGSPLAAGSSCYVYVTFSPNANGPQTASLSVTDTATGSPQTASVFGVGQTVSSTAAFSKSTVDLGAETLAVVSGQASISVQNTGNINITVSSVLLGGTNPADFSISSDSCTSGAVAPSSYCYVYVTFTPKATGLRKATLTFTDNATGSPQVVNLEGTGVAVTQTLALQYLDYDFGVSTVGVATSQQYFTIENTGDSPVSFTSEAITGTNASDFTITSNNCPSPGNPLNALSTCYLYITFTPGASGVRTASLQYTDSATGSPQSTALAGVGLAPSQTLAFSSPTLIFTPVTVSTSGGQLDVEITNAGDQNVTFTGVNIIGTDAGDFSISSNGCASLTPATSCYVYVNYDPNTVGILSAALQLTDTATGSPQSIPLASDSESAGGVLSLTTLLMNFGGVNTSSSGTPIQVTVSNETGSTVTFSQAIVGQNASDYSVTSNTCTGSLINGANCAVSVNVTPSATGLRLGALEFTTGGIAQDVLLTAVGSSAATIVTLQSAYDFGKENVGTSSQQQLQLQNTGTENVTFTGTSITGTDPSDYTVAYSTCTVLAPGQTCTISVVFAPTAAGLRTAKLTISDSGAGSPQSVNLSGVGQAAGAGLSVATAVDFGAENVGTPYQQGINLFNNGTSTVTISSFAISGTNASDFAVSNSYFCNTIATFTNCNITVTFNPAAAGVRSATLTITDNATGSPQTVGLSGLGVAVAVTLSAPTALAFPGTVIGTTNQESVLVQNIGTAAANISSITITGTNASDYSIYQSCTTITPASGCNVYVAFTPAGAGVRTASLVITSNAKGSPLTVAMNGIGQAAISTLSLPASIAFPTTTQGTVSTVTFPIYNTGNTTITFSKVAVTGALAADFSVGYWCPTLTPGGECTIYVSFTNVPGGAGLATPNLQFTDNAAGSPQSVLLTGIIQGATTTVGLSTTALSFGNQAVGTASGAQTVYVYNTGNGVVTVNSVKISGTDPSDFAITGGNCPGATLNGGNFDGNYCYVSVEFVPTATGSRAATLTVTDTAVGATQTVALSGTGM